MTTNRKAQWLKNLTRVLLSNGWYSVCNQESGLYWRKGNVLVVGTELEDSVIEMFCLPKVIRTVEHSLVNQKKTNWYIERNGIVIAYGNLSRKILDSLNEDGSNAFIEMLNAYTEQSDVLSAAKALVKGTTQVAEMHDDFIPMDKGVMETRLVRARDSGKVYYIVGGNQTDVALVEVAIQYGPTDELKYSDELITCTKEEFNNRRATGTLEVVGVMGRMVEVAKPVMRKLVAAPIADVPAEFKSFGLSSQQLLMLGIGIAACTNVTPILNPRNNVNGDGIELFSNALIDLEWICHAGLSAKVFTKLYQAHNMGVDVSKLNVPNLTPEAVDYMVNEELEECTEMSRMEIVLYSLGGTGTGIMDLMQFYARKFRLTTVMDSMRLYGISSDNKVSLSWKQITDKSAVYSFLSWEGLVFDDGICWNAVLERLMDIGDYFIFSPAAGFILQTYVGGFGRDTNGLVLYDRELKPVWRVIYLNEKTYCYGDSSWLTDFRNVRF